MDKVKKYLAYLGFCKNFIFFILQNIVSLLFFNFTLIFMKASVHFKLTYGHVF
jgi:hypothetical protein